MRRMGVFETVLVKTIEFIFAAGIIGSAIVLVLTTIEDVEVMFERDSGERHAVIEERY